MLGDGEWYVCDPQARVLCQWGLMVDGSAQYLFLGIHSSGQRSPMLYLESAGVTLPVWLL